MDRLVSYARINRASLDEESRRVEVIASTGDLARDFAIIEPRGWDLSFYERNPVVLWGHDDRSNPPIARTIESRITDDGLVQVHEFDAEGNDPFADRIFRKVVSGMVNAVSVRWLPGLVEWRKQGVKGADGKMSEREVLVFVKGHQLLETSYVSIPADPGAVIKRADGGEFDVRAYIQPEPAPVAVRDPFARFVAAMAAGLGAANQQFKEARGG